MRRATRRAWLLLLPLTLAACTAPMPRPAAPAAQVVEAAVEPIASRHEASRPVAPIPLSADPGERSPWQRMRERFSMQGCDYSPAAMAWARRYSASPEAFQRSWSEAMPFLLPVLEEIERRDLPGEFALLPYVESTYRPMISEGNRPAGMWQLMPLTARGGGVRVQDNYDGRLDPFESTRVAMDLIERYDRVFGDWRLANLAFNAGEFRLKKLLGNRLQEDLSREELERLPLNPSSHEHLAKLLGLSCVISDPQRFKIDLPEPTVDDQLVRIELAGPIDLRLAANFAGMPVEDLRQFNAAWLGKSDTSGIHSHLLVPKPHIEPFRAAAVAIPTNLHAEWKTVQVAATTTLAELAEGRKIDPDMLALANGLAIDAPLSRGEEVLVPGREAVAAEPRSAVTASAAHVVARGDTLSSIARAYSVRIPDLLRWNRMHRGATLRIGMRLSVRGPML